MIPAVEGYKPRVNAHHVIPTEAHAARGLAADGDRTNTPRRTKASQRKRKMHDKRLAVSRKSEDSNAELPLQDSTAVYATSSTSLNSTRQQCQSSTPTASHMATPAPPNTLKQARRSAHAEQWDTEYREEMEALKDAGAFKIVPRSELPRGAFVPKGDWSFTHQTAKTGDVIGRKARLAYLGNSLAQELHYDPSQLATHTADRDAIPIVLALAVSTGMTLKHIDIKRAFLHAKYIANIGSPVATSQCTSRSL